MNSIGMDLGKKKSDVCVLDESGAVVERFQLATTRAALWKHFGVRQPARVVFESCRDAQW